MREDSSRNEYIAFDIELALDRGKIKKAKELLSGIEVALIQENLVALLTSAASNCPMAMPLLLGIDGVKEFVSGMIETMCNEIREQERRSLEGGSYEISSDCTRVLELLNFREIEHLSRDEDVQWIRGKIPLLHSQDAWPLVTNRFVKKVVREEDGISSDFIKCIAGYDRLKELRGLFRSVLFFYTRAKFRQVGSGREELLMFPLVPKEVWEVIMKIVWGLSYMYDYSNQSERIVPDYYYEHKRRTGLEGKYAAYNGPLTEENVKECLFPIPK